MNAFLLNQIRTRKMDILILCNQNDTIALAVYEELSNSQKNICLVTAEQLIYAPYWKHVLNAKGKGYTEIILQNGLAIRSGELKVVWNRIRFFNMAHFINETDRQYAQTEMFALYFSFLKSINAALIDPVETNDLSMGEDNLLHLKHQAIKAGLPVLDSHYTSSPKWQSTKGLVPVTIQRNTASSFQKKAPYLVWQNQPTLFTEASSGIIKRWIVGTDIIEGQMTSYKTALKKLSKNLKKAFLEVHFTNTSTGYKLSVIHTYPVWAPQPVTRAVANLLIKKTGRST